MFTDRATTLTVVDPGLKPALVAVIVALPTPPVVTATFTPVVFSGIVAVAGTEATDGLLLCKITTWPPVAAGTDNLSVSVPVELLATVSGLGVSVTASDAAAVIVTVAGAL